MGLGVVLIASRLTSKINSSSEQSAVIGQISHDDSFCLRVRVLPGIAWKTQEELEIVLVSHVKDMEPGQTHTAKTRLTQVAGPVVSPFKPGDGDSVHICRIWKFLWEEVQPD